MKHNLDDIKSEYYKVPEPEEEDTLIVSVVSVCCDAPVVVDGKTTLFYICTACQKPCDTEEE